MTLNQVVHFYYIVILFCFTKLKSIFSYAFTLLLKLHCLFIKLIIFSFFLRLPFFSFSLAFEFFYCQYELTAYFKRVAVLRQTLFLTGPADPSLGGDFKNYYKQTCPVIKKQSSSPFIIPFWPRPLTLGHFLSSLGYVLPTLARPRQSSYIAWFTMTKWLCYNVRAKVNQFHCETKFIVIYSYF